MPLGRRRLLKCMGAAALLPILPGLAKSTNSTFGRTGTHRVLSCNIRVALDEDEAKGVGWSVRRKICLKIIHDKKPDIVGLQEVLKVQADDIRKYFPSYQLFGFEGPEMDAHTTGYYGIAKNPILFSRDRYDLLTGGTYWLSETPLVAGSKSWDTARARNASWVRLREKRTGVEFRVINLHLDHVAAEAKIKQAKLVADESAQYLPDYNQILTGDFNSRFDSAVFNSLRNNGWKESYETIYGQKEAGFTAHEFKGAAYEKGPSKGRIDYIWYRGKVKPVSSVILKDMVDGKYPSDHFFVQTDFTIQ